MNVFRVYPDRGRPTEMLFVTFNQDAGCFACGTDSGFRIYNVDPFKETFKRNFNNGIGIVEMLFRCNLLALVGGGHSPRYPPNKVMIWDDHQNRCVGELSFRSDVRAVKLRRDRVVVVLATKVYVYRFSDLKLLDQIDTQPNPRGLVALCAHPKHNVLACPGVTRGHARVELYDSRKSTTIAAHESDLARLSLSEDGSLLATASDKGTLIRVFNAHSGAQLREFRRGVDRALVYSLVFCPETKYLACSSDKGTVHVFNLKSEGGRVVAPNASSSTSPYVEDHMSQHNQKSHLSFLRKVVPGGLAAAYLESEWSFAQVRGVRAPTICAFGKTPNTIVSIGADGAFLVSQFGNGGECERVSFHRFIKSKEEEEFDVPPWNDPRTFGPGGPLHRPKKPAPGQPFIDPKAGTISADKPPATAAPHTREAPDDDGPAVPPAPPPAPPPVVVEYPDLGASIYHEAPEADDAPSEDGAPRAVLGASVYHEAPEEEVDEAPRVDLGASVYHEAPEEDDDDESPEDAPRVDLGASIYHEAQSGDLSN